LYKQYNLQESLKMLTNNINFRNYQNYSAPQSRITPNAEKAPNSQLSGDTVSFSSKNKNKLGFSSQFLYNTNIKQLDENGEAKFIPAKITKLNPDDTEDVEAMKTINKSWIKTAYGDEITYNFKHPKNIDLYLAVELDDDKKELADKILCLAQTSSKADHRARGYNDIHLRHLQSAPACEHGKKENQFKGAGEVLMYGICKYAKDLGFSDLTLYSTNNPFYNHLEMPKAPDLGMSYYAFRKDAMNRFMNKIEEKYEIPKQD